MKIRLSQLFFVLSQPKLSVPFKKFFSLTFFKEAIVILSSMYRFGEIHLPTYLPTYHYYYYYYYYYFQTRYFWFHLKISRHHMLTQKGLWIFKIQIIRALTNSEETTAAWLEGYLWGMI